MIELISAYEFMGYTDGRGVKLTYQTATTVAKVKQGRKFFYLIPFGIDYECDGGHHIGILSEKEFFDRYSLEFVGYKTEKRSSC